jgi:hypothetical protein
VLVRSLAVLIAVLGLIDPAVTSTRRTRPEVALVAAPDANGPLARRVSDALDDEFTVIRAPFSGAAATVLVGERLGSNVAPLASPVFAVLPAQIGSRVVIERLEAPRRAALESRTVVSATADVRGARGRQVELSLLRGDLVVDRVIRDVASDDERLTTELAFVPTSTGAVPMRVSARIVAAEASAVAADVVVDIGEQRWGVLFFDPRPSWQSTFVRRAIERDPRFVVTSRVVTSRSVSTDAGHPPSTLADLGSLADFDAIVVGGPDALSERDVAGLETYLRRRGGTVVLLLDQRDAGPYQRLTGVRDWMATSSGAGFVVRAADGDSVALRASEIAWPRALPAGARAVAAARPTGADSVLRHPVLWESAVGAGRLIVSGALDTWRFRDPLVSRFDEFWRRTVASAADAALPPMTVWLPSGVVAPRERTDVRVMMRDASLATLGSNRSVTASVSVSIETGAGTVPIRVWPDGAIGELRGRFRAPSAPGTYRVSVTGDGIRVDAPLVVADTVARAGGDDRDLVTMWARTHGGESIEADELNALVPAIQRVARPIARRETWYPMRSAWWIIPFVLLLGAEWLSRRRTGLA